MNRKIDDLGRLVIPKEMRKQLGIKNNDPVNIECTGDKIIITNPNKKDDFKEFILNEIKSGQKSLGLEFILKAYEELK